MWSSVLDSVTKAAQQAGKVAAEAAHKAAVSLLPAFTARPALPTLPCPPRLARLPCTPAVLALQISPPL